MKKIIITTALAISMMTACGGKAEHTTAEPVASAQTASENPSETSKGVATSETIATKSEDDPDAIKAQLEITPQKTLDGEVCLFITNNSNTTIDELSVQINYKNGSGNTIDTADDGHDMVLPGSTVVSKLSAPPEYDDFEINSDIKLNCYPSYQNHADKVSVSSNQGEDGIIIEITNNDSVSIDEIEYIVVYYKGNDIAHVDYPQDIANVEAGKTVTEKASPYDVDYDSYEVYLNQAHTF
ncbi:MULTISPECIES: hypothetical protein [unclassified Clostridium]|uniref:hypothetical protein n=1 Tax=unclassified Clostridium TaxID=2614128 RepID=UPI00033D0962|nr:MULTISPECIES: hypothetical protein [unclassified Clostridium]CCY00514.1 putative uncharacterized protein [Enterocloster bolteae CAG:59]DAF65818.1 MAG TPA: protein of unknown function DUF4969 [Caudoviricetes sp.]